MLHVYTFPCVFTNIFELKKVLQVSNVPNERVANNAGNTFLTELNYFYYAESKYHIIWKRRALSEIIALFRKFLR